MARNGGVPQVLATEYASYRSEVLVVLDSKLEIAQRSRSRPLIIYDPMAGTAPLLSLSERKGYTAYLNDLNSLHLYVNAAKTLPSYLAFKEIGTTELLSIVRKMAPKLDRCPRTVTEEWIEGPVLNQLRRGWDQSNNQNEPLGTLTKAIILLAIRQFSCFVKTQNPTWLKPGGLRPKASSKQAFLAAIQRLDHFYHQVYENSGPIKGGRILLTDYDASQCPPKCSVDVVMTSPPFCNRVDWDRMYGPEHFFLNAVGAWHTSAKFLGTTSVHLYQSFESDYEFVAKRSEYVAQFLRRVRERQIRNDRQYYVRYFTRYFASLFRVFDIAAGALSTENAGIYFAVQDNTHRGLLIQIGEALQESLSNQGFRVRIVRPTWDRPHLGLRNVSKRYKLVSPKQSESIWHAKRWSLKKS